MTGPATLRSATVVLRALTTLHAPSLFEAYGDPLVLRYWLSAPHRDVDETRRLIEANTGDELVFGIAAATAPRSVV